MTCAVCGMGLDGEPVAHASCVPAGLLREAALTVLELIAVAATPMIVVWAG
ncbi:hypothetical protein [Solirubrobacter soli]|uniref:hypothetical protein n=1 Tax=Solirubrobacter soli TaxID=363832 RepID=UPI0012FB22F6|nr:hypothetical protein [Solirubrobacter soli]